MIYRNFLQTDSPLSTWLRMGVVATVLGLSACAQVPTESQSEADKAKDSPILASGLIFENAPYPQAHASTIVETTPGKLVASWFGGTYERHPDVEIWVAHYENGQWQEAVAVADGVQADGTRYPTWNPVLFIAPGADLHLFYKVGPNPREWWGMVMTSPDGGYSWTEPRRLPDGILGPIKNKPVLVTNGAWLSPSSTEEPSVGWRMHFERSSDQGRTWERTESVAPGPGFDAIQPSILLHTDDKLQALARTRQGVIGSSWSHDRGRTWSPVSAIELPNPSSGTDAVTLADGRHLLIYNHFAHSPETPGKGLRYPINLAISEDGIRWKMVMVLEDTPQRDGYAYPAIIQTRDGLVHLTYTWNRELIKHVILDPAKL